MVRKGNNPPQSAELIERHVNHHALLYMSLLQADFDCESEALWVLPLSICIPLSLQGAL